MNNILSIDLDILLSPYCGIYNELINPTIDKNYNWKEINKDFDINDFIINDDYLLLITKIIQHYSKLVSKIYISYDHGSILNAIQNEKDNFKNDYKFNIYNIDYHHDICYTDRQKNLIIEQGLADCGSWAGFLNYYNCINSYTWYRGIGSNINTYDIFKPLNYNIKLLDDFNYNLNIDLFFISLSPPWFPPHCLTTIEKIIKNIEQSKIYYINGGYSINYDKKNFLNRI